MKTITLLSIMILISASTTFAGSVENKNLETTIAVCDCTTAGQLECMQTETQQISKAKSSEMTFMVLEKLRRIDSLASEGALMDRLQKETEDISIVKPIVAFAAIIEKQIEKHRQKNIAFATTK